MLHLTFKIGTFKGLYIYLCINAHVSFTQILNCSLLNVQIYDQGYSRIPVYEQTRDNVIGLLLVKMLIRTDICEKKTIRSLVASLLTPKFCLKVTPLYTALNQFFIVKSEFRIYHVISYQSENGYVVYWESLASHAKPFKPLPYSAI